MSSMLAARPGEGAVSGFAFGRSAGVVAGILAACGIPLSYITASHWKRLVGIAPGRDAAKDAARAMAIAKWPKHASMFALRYSAQVRAERRRHFAAVEAVAEDRRRRREAVEGLLASGDIKVSELRRYARRSARDNPTPRQGSRHQALRRAGRVARAPLESRAPVRPIVRSDDARPALRTSSLSKTTALPLSRMIARTACSASSGVLARMSMVESTEYVTLGQSAFVQGYTQVVTAKSVDIGNGLPQSHFRAGTALAADPAATAKYYKPSLAGNGLLASMKPIATEPDCGVELIGTDAGIEPSGRIAALRGTRRPLSTRPMKLWRTTSS